MAVPQVAIVGRPNVGKSSIMNWLAGKRVSVVDPSAGVTRDRVSYLMEQGDRYFELIDTGGVGIVDSDALSDDVEQQINYALDVADLIIFVVDGTMGILPLDRTVATRLHKLNRPTLMVVNKCDSSKAVDESPNFLQMMQVPLVTTSVKANRGRHELLAAILEHLPPPADDSGDDESVSVPLMKLAIVGRRNVGKSTFINALVDAPRMIVSEIAGTTRDSVDVRFEQDGHAFIAIDTPGVRKKKSLENDVEFYGLVRAQKSVRRADVVLMFFDATQTISQVDKQLVTEIADHFKPCIFVVNKWDLGLEAEMTSDRWAEYLLKTFPSMPYIPVAFVTAKEKKNIRRLVNLAQTMFKQAQGRVSTGLLNRVIGEAVKRNPPPHRANLQPRMYYATQVGTAPPTIVIKCSHPKYIDPTWKRYLSHSLHEALPFPEIPIKFYFRDRHAESFATPRPEGRDNAPLGVEWTADAWQAAIDAGNWDAAGDDDDFEGDDHVSGPALGDDDDEFDSSAANDDAWRGHRIDAEAPDDDDFDSAADRGDTDDDDINEHDTVDDDTVDDYGPADCDDADTVELDVVELDLVGDDAGTASSGGDHTRFHAAGDVTDPVHGDSDELPAGGDSDRP